MPKTLEFSAQQLLKQSPLFNALNQQQFEQIEQHSCILSIKSEQFLFHQSSNYQNFFILSSGMIKLFRLTPNGNEKVIEIIRPGQSFAEAIMFMDKPCYPVHAVALKSSQVIAINANEYKKILSNSIETCFGVMAIMSVRLRELLYEVDRLTLHNATFRIISFLLDLKSHQKIDEISLKLDISKQTIASQLAIKPETLSRILKQLANKNLIKTKENAIYLLNETALKSIIQNECT